MQFQWTKLNHSCTGTISQLIKRWHPEAILLLFGACLLYCISSTALGSYPDGIPSISAAWRWKRADDLGSTWEVGKWGFLKWGYPQIIHFSRIFPYKPSFLGIPIYGNPQMAVIVDVLSQVEGFITMYTAIFNPNSIPSSACYSMEGVGWSNVSGTTSSIDKRSPSETMRYKHPSGWSETFTRSHHTYPYISIHDGHHWRQNQKTVDRLWFYLKQSMIKMSIFGICLAWGALEGFTWVRCGVHGHPCSCNICGISIDSWFHPTLPHQRET